MSARGEPRGIRHLKALEKAMGPDTTLEEARQRLERAWAGEDNTGNHGSQAASEAYAQEFMVWVPEAGEQR